MPTSLLHPLRPDDKALHAFFDRHRDLLAEERKIEEEQTRLLNSNCSQKELESKGLSIGRLGVSRVSVGLGGKNLVELHRPLAYHSSQLLPPHTFRNGDPVRIELHSSSSGKKGKKKADEEVEGAAEGIVYRVSREKIVVAVDGSKDVDLPERVRLLKLANSVTFDRMEKAIRHLERIVVPETETQAQLPANNLSLVHTLIGAELPTWDAEVPPTVEQISAAGGGIIPQSEIKWYGDRLNESQKDAIEFCLKADDFACIHGPPGTGKTHTLVELIFQLLSRPASSVTSQPPRILVTTPSNLALDNLLLRLHALAKLEPYSALLPPGSILRLGHPTRVHRDLVGETLDYRAAHGDDGELVRDVGREIESHLSDLGKKRGDKGAVKGKERGLKWGEVRELRKEYRQREAKVVINVVSAARVVLATCHSAGSRQINNIFFDVCIVDEATQAIEAVCWVPILRSRKLILAGDPQQLPPTITSKRSGKIREPPIAAGGEKQGENGQTSDEERLVEGTDTVSLKGNPGRDTRRETDLRTVLKPPRSLETTLFDRLEKLYGPGIKRVLKVQYRMNDKIAAFPSKTLYADELISSPTVADRTLSTLPTITGNSSDDTADALEPTVIFFDTSGCEFYERSDGDAQGVGEGSKSNENEAEVVTKWARRLVTLGVPPAEIAVICPYQAQVSLISSMLHQDYPEMTIGTVDGLQGQERDAVILSLVRSNAKGEVGFLGEYRRLNVAMTRPRRQLCVVGDSETVAKGSKYLKAWMDWLEEHADVRWAGEEV